MEIILLEDVKTLGKKGEIVKVSDGYGRNLISKKICLEATAKNKNDLKLKAIHDEKIVMDKLEEARQLAAAIDQKEITLSMKAGENGKLFGAISSKEIAAAVHTQLGFDIDKKKLQLAEPIKALGNHNVVIKVHPKVSSSLRVKIVKET